MKKNRQLFNTLLIRYNKYQRKLKNLSLANRNIRRQSIIVRHIERLYEKLTSLKVSIQKSTVVTAAVLGVAAFAPQNTVAQTFGAPQTNAFSLVNMGSSNNASVSYADLDNDNDLDILTSNDYGDFLYYENTGTISVPVFGTVQPNPFSLSNIGGTWTDPQFVDLDNDGDFDIMVGDSWGDWRYYENTGTVSVPAYGAAQLNPFSLAYIGYSSSASFADLDNDGDLDLLAGENYGNFHYFENTGTASAPTFGAPQTNPFSLTGVPFYSYSRPTLIDFDNDGDFDMMSGNEDGDFLYYENTGSASAPAFGARQTNPYSLTNQGANYSGPAFGDLDNDGDLDIMSHEKHGDFYYFENTSTGCNTNSTVDITSSPTLTSNQTAGSPTFRWLDCDNNNAAIPSETSQSFTASVTGNYAVEVTVGSCVDTSACQNVFICNTDNTIDISSLPTLTANQTTGSPTYRWLDCDDNNAAIPSETSQSYTATVTGNYAVEITVGSCVDTSACQIVNVTSTGVHDLTANQVSIYPNPTNGMVNLNFGDINSEINYTITSISGREIGSGKTLKNNVSIDLTNESNGIYFIRVYSKKASFAYKLIKK